MSNIIFGTEQLLSRGFITVHEEHAPNGEKHYIGLIFKDRTTGLYVAKDAQGNELFPRAEALEEQQDRFIIRKQRGKQEIATSINR